MAVIDERFLQAFETRSWIRHREFDSEVAHGLDHKIRARPRNGAHRHRRSDIPRLALQLRIRGSRHAARGLRGSGAALRLSFHEWRGGYQRCRSGGCSRRVFQEAATANGSFWCFAHNLIVALFHKFDFATIISSSAGEMAVAPLLDTIEPRMFF